MTAEISIRDIGPILEFEHTFKGFGLTMLQGKQGAGKTTVLRTVQLLIDGKTDVRPTSRDGVKVGEATVAGRTIRISKTTRSEGELTIEGIGNFDLVSLHSPPFANAETCDRQRIKILVRLAGIEPDKQLFFDLVGGPGAFGVITDECDLDADDLVELAMKVKRSFEKAAKKEEQVADVATRYARQLIESAGGAGGVGVRPSDIPALQGAVTAAVAQHVTLTERRTSAMRTIAMAEETQRELDATVAPSLSVTDALSAVDKAVVTRHDALTRVAECKQALQTAQANAQAAVQMKDSAEQDHTAAQQHAETIERWQVQIDAAKSVECPSQDDLEAASAEVLATNNAVTEGIKTNDAIEARQNSERETDKARAADHCAERLRIAATGTQDVLSRAIASIPDCPLRVKVMDDGAVRLVITTTRATDEPFDELSDGERWPHLLKLCAGHNRMIVLSQASFGELSPETRRNLHQLAIEHECYLLTAQADDGELRATYYGDLLEAV